MVGRLLEELGSQAEKGGYEVVGNAQLLKFPRRVKTSHKRILVVCGWKVAARQEAQGRSNNPNTGHRAWPHVRWREWRGRGETWRPGKDKVGQSWRWMEKGGDRGAS